MDYYLQIQNLMILLNSLYSQKNTELEVYSLIPNLKIGNISLKDSNRSLFIPVSKESLLYLDRLSKNECKRLLPSYQNYMHAIIHSGLIKPENWSKFVDSIKNFLNSDLIPYSPRFVTLDTNIYLRGYYKEIVKEISNINAESNKISKRILPITFIIPNGVRDELFDYDRKYNEKDLDRLKMTLANNRYIGELFNQRIAFIRYFMLGRRSYDDLIAKESFITIKGDRDDDKIAKSIEEFVDKHKGLPLFITEDSSACSTFKVKNIRTILLDPIKFLPEQLEGEWDNIVRLLSNLSLIFGGIRIKSDSGTIDLWGIWRGKRVQEDNMELCKIKTNDDKILNKIKRYSEILNIYQKYL